MNGATKVGFDLRSASEVRAAAFDRLGACAAVLDSDGVIVDTNQAWRLFAHLNDGQIDTTGVGMNYLDVCDRAAAEGASASADVAAGLREILSGERERTDVEYPCPSPAEDRWFLLQASALPVREGAGAVVFHVDITARKQLTHRLAILADHDALTGLPNRRAAVQYLQRRLGRARSTDKAVWVMFIDIDQFKAVNDTYGHHVGDELLVKVGMRTRRALRESDELCRLGGDEFVVICPGFDREEVLGLAERLRTAMSEPFQIGSLEVFGNISIGIAESDPTSTAESMLQAADRQMYVDKRRARLPSLKADDFLPQLSPIATHPLLAREVPAKQAVVGRRSDERTRAAAALMNSNDLILFFSSDGTIEWASPACTGLLGVRPGDLVGLNGIDLIHPDDRASALAAFMSIPNLGDHVRTDFRVIDINGRIRWIEEIATNLIDDPAVGSVVGNLHDVTERVELLERIELDRRRLADAQSAACLGSFELDLATGDISRSDELCRILGVPIGSGANSDSLDTIHPDDRELLTEMLDQAIAGRERGEIEYRIIRPTGEVRWVRTQGVKLVKPNAIVIAGTMLDITDRHDADEAVAFQATHDWLTGLPNPASLHASLEQTLATVGPDAHVMVAVIGIDNFRQFNDTRSSTAGDEALRSLATRLRAGTEPGDLVGRLRDDEFIVARRASVADGGAVEFGQTLKDLLGEPPSVDEDDVLYHRRSFSVGVTSSTENDSPESMLADADAAMREAKHDGGDCVVVFDDSARSRATRRRNITDALHFGLARNEFRLEYQPIVNLASLRTVGFEALLRWTHPELGPISPNEFIPIAESNRLIAPIGTWVIDTALQQLADWRLDPCVPDDLWMAINLSAQQLSQAHLPSQIGEAVERLGIPPESVHLEITESVLMDGVDNGRQAISDLHELGVRISIDDFGTGYSSLSYLSRLTVDTIKIDRSFVSELSAARDGTSIIRAISTLANSLDLDTVAEGIESIEQLDILRTLGCINGQGFLWSRALHPNDALSWIRDSESSHVASVITPVSCGQPPERALGNAIVHIAMSSGKRRCEPRDLRNLLRFDNLDIGLHARKAWIAGRDLRLTAKEFELLAHLATHPDETFSRGELLEHVWHSSSAWQNEATVTEHIYRLRNHIEPDPGQPTRLRTDRGFGYRFVS